MAKNKENGFQIRVEPILLNFWLLSLIIYRLGSQFIFIYVYFMY